MGLPVTTQPGIEPVISMTCIQLLVIEYKPWIEYFNTQMWCCSVLLYFSPFLLFLSHSRSPSPSLFPQVLQVLSVLSVNSDLLWRDGLRNLTQTEVLERVLTLAEGFAHRWAQPPRAWNINTLLSFSHYWAESSQSNPGLPGCSSTTTVVEAMLVRQCGKPAQ